MQIKTTTDRLDINQGDSPTLPPKNSKRRTLFPFAILFAMVCAILLMDAILPLRDLWFHEALLTQLGSWPVLPSRILFPGWPLIPPVPHLPETPPRVIQSWEQLPLMLGSFVLVFVLYLLALRRLPAQVSRRFIFTSTALLGFLYILIPIVTSRDLYSYIAYARIGVIHHLNPLTTLPTAICRSDKICDEIYNYVYWAHQPSAYGPTWIFLTSSLQWLFTLFGVNHIIPMLIALRFLGLAMHLLSTLLIWKISGQLQRPNGIISPTTRLRATLAFAWNPLLLFEACVNAHNDTTLLPLILLAVWFLVRAPMAMGPIMHSWTSVGADLSRPTPIYRPLLSHPVRDKLAPYAPFILAAAMLALATCLKINIVLLVPGLLLYAWTQEPVRGRLKRVVAVTATYTGLILLCYAPFWQGGAILHVLFVNPGIYRTINTPADFLGHFYNSIMSDFGHPTGALIGSPAERIVHTQGLQHATNDLTDLISSPAERIMHTLSLGIFVIIYLLLCWQVIRRPGRISNVQGLIRWMAVTWLVYCALGSPWFWPWYLVTFFGLYALIEAFSGDSNALFDLVRWPAGTETYFVRLFSFSMLSLYCFSVWATFNSFVPGLPGFEWSYFSGLWAWILPLVAVALLIRSPKVIPSGRPQG